MNIYIYGKKCDIQESLIRKFCTDLEEIYYITSCNFNFDRGVLHLSSSVYPVLDFSYESLLNDDSIVFGDYWYLSSDDDKQFSWGEIVPSNPVKITEEDDWWHLFGDNEFTEAKYVSDCFLYISRPNMGHLNTLYRNMCDSLKKDPISLSGRFLKEKNIWKKAGKPLRTPSDIAAIFKICESCPNFNRHSEKVGDCNICGCYVKAEGSFLNKISKATSHCPDNPSKW